MSAFQKKVKMDQRHLSLNTSMDGKMSYSFKKRKISDLGISSLSLMKMMSSSLSPLKRERPTAVRCLLMEASARTPSLEQRIQQGRCNEGFNAGPIAFAFWILGLGENLGFGRKFWVWAKILGLGENFRFGKNFWVRAKILCSGENFGFGRKF